MGSMLVSAIAFAAVCAGGKAVLVAPYLGVPLWYILVATFGPMLANEIVQRAKGTRAQSLLQFIAMLILKLPVVGKAIAKFPVVGDILYMFSPQDKSGLPTPIFAKATTTAVEIPVIVQANSSKSILNEVTGDKKNG